MCKDELTQERETNIHLKAEVDKLKIQLDYATNQLQNPTQAVPKTDDVLPHPPRRGAQDDHVDAAIVDREAPKKASPIPQESEGQAQQAAPRRRWGRGTRVPEDQQGRQQEDEFRVPEVRKGKKKRRTGGLSMLEEHLGVVHNDDGEVIYEHVD